MSDCNSSQFFINCIRQYISFLFVALTVTVNVGIDPIIGNLIGIRNGRNSFSRLKKLISYCIEVKKNIKHAQKLRFVTLVNALRK